MINGQKNPCKRLREKKPADGSGGIGCIMLEAIARTISRSRKALEKRYLIAVERCFTRKKRSISGHDFACTKRTLLNLLTTGGMTMGY